MLASSKRIQVAVSPKSHKERSFLQCVHTNGNTCHMSLFPFLLKDNCEKYMTLYCYSDPERHWQQENLCWQKSEVFLDPKLGYIDEFVTFHSTVHPGSASSLLQVESSQSLNTSKGLLKKLMSTIFSYPYLFFYVGRFKLKHDKKK